MTEEVAQKSKAGRKSRATIEAEMTSSPSFQAAVQAAVQEQIASLIPQLQAARAIAGTAPEANDMSQMQALALAISELTTQGTGKVRVAPEVLMKREQARERMTKLIIAARAEKKVPTYQLRNKVLLNERLIEPMWSGSDHVARPTEIDFWGVPNDAMVPVNDVAKEIFTAFKDSVGSVHGVKGVENGLPKEDDLGITRGGLVVRNTAINSGIRKATPERPAWEGPMPAYEDEAPQTTGDPAHEPLRVHNDTAKGKFSPVNVLGTIQPPAQQTV